MRMGAGQRPVYELAGRVLQESPLSLLLLRLHMEKYFQSHVNVSAP